MGDGIVDTLVNWICDGLFVGIGVNGVKIDDVYLVKHKRRGSK